MNMTNKGASDAELTILDSNGRDVNIRLRPGGQAIIGLDRYLPPLQLSSSMGGRTGTGVADSEDCVVTIEADGSLQITG